MEPKTGQKHRSVILFGGTGFIGSHLARFLVENGISEVLLADLRPPAKQLDARIRYVQLDVRTEIPKDLVAERPDLLVNLAAVHREPGHEPHEYFETNVKGAENVCRYAERVGCETQIFTSSISVYGPTEEERDEQSLPTPVSPYGSSKLLAEYIYSSWQRADARRRLVTVRPGVVFGPGESGNVTRLIRAVTRGYFAYLGNRHVLKAGGYVKELCRTLAWALQTLEGEQQSSLLYNFSFDPTPRLDEFVAAISEVARRSRPRLSLPFFPVLVASHAAQGVAEVLGIEQPFHPVRARKLIRSNHITAGVLRRHRYTARYDLKAALADWRESCPSDWS